MGMARNQGRIKIIDAISVSRRSYGHSFGTVRRAFVRVSPVPVIWRGPQSVKHLSGVMEGYSIDPTAPLVAQNGHTSASEGVAEPAQIFQSSRDINHRVLRNWTPSPFSSPKKRNRYDYEAEDALEEEAEGEGMEVDPGESNPQTTAQDNSQRPIKPLRRALFADPSVASRPSVSQNQTLYANNDSSRSENPFLE